MMAWTAKIERLAIDERLAAARGAHRGQGRALGTPLHLRGTKLLDALDVQPEVPEGIPQSGHALPAEVDEWEHDARACRVHPLEGRVDIVDTKLQDHG
jgi:hypothetical protein